VKAMIEPTYWNDPDFDHIEDLNPLAFYLYCISNSDVTCIGAYRFSYRKATHETRLERKDLERAFKVLGVKLRYDEKTGWIWVPGYFARQFPSVPHINMVKSVLGTLSALEDSDFPWWQEFYDKNSSLIKRFQTAYKERTKDFESLKGNGKEKGEGKEKKVRAIVKESDKRKKRVEINSPLMVRIGKWFNRKDYTLWTIYEEESLAMLRPLVKDDVDVVEKYYLHTVVKDEFHPKRLNLETVLNNWQSEVDRARGWLPAKPTGGFVQR